jgi:hypothetical protein
MGSVDASQDIALNKKYFLEDLHLTMMIAIDSTRQRPNDDPSVVPDYEDDRIGGFFAAIRYPTFYVIDRNGVIRNQFFGYDEEKINRAIEALVGSADTQASSQKSR